jgi:hypothetical protein
VASLQLALLEKRRDESLFWTYELYFSGLTGLAWSTVESLYALNWEKYNPKLRKYLLSKRNAGADNGIGSIVLTLCLRPSNQPNNEKFLFSLSEIALEPYRTIDSSKTKPREYLKTVSKFAVIYEGKDTEINAAFLGPDWLYYCADTPYWANIFETYGMKADVSNKRIEFPEDDDRIEQFFGIYGYEPDEQSIELEKMHGIIL